MKFKILLFAIMAFFLYSCEDSLEDFHPNENGFAYYPLKVGNTWVYQLDSVVYDNNGLRIDTISTRLKETITESFIDQGGDIAFRIKREQFDGSLWKITDIWSASSTEKLAFRTEENLRFAKLSFPVNKDKTWDGNAYFNEDVVVKIAGEPIRIYQNWGNYAYSEVGQAEQIADRDYDKVCTIVQVDLEDKITRRYSIEKYAEGYGLVYKNMIILNTQKFDSEDSWEVKAEEGFILEQSLISFEEG